MNLRSKSGAMIIAAIGLILIVGIHIAVNQTNYRVADETLLGDLVIDTTGKSAGQPSEHYFKDRKFYVMRLTNEQTADLKRLGDHVWDPSTPGCSQDLQLCVFWANAGVDAEESIHLPKRRGSASARRHWLGGFLSMGDDVSYDYAGRAIASDQFSAFDSAQQASNLAAPEHTIADGILIINPR